VTLCTLQCFLPSTALALSSTAGTAFSPVQMKYTPDNLLTDKVGVSVVRLVATYGEGTSQVLLCSSLGLLIDSRSTADGFQNWVLTDASQINASVSSCGTPADNANNLKELQIWASSEYANTTTAHPDSVEIVNLSCTTGTNNLAACGDSTISIAASGSDSSYAYFSFASLYEQPYLMPDFTSSPAEGQAIGLLSPQGQTPGKLDFSNLSLVQSYLQPRQVPSGVALEGGTALVNSQGNLVGMELSNGTSLPLSMLSSGLNAAGWSDSDSSVEGRATSLAGEWDAAVDTYYSGNKAAALAAFDLVQQKKNPQFAAPEAFKAVLQPAPTATPGSSTGNLKPVPQSNSGPLSIVLHQVNALGLPIVAGGGVVLLLVLILLILFWRRTRKRRALKKFEAEQITAHQQAEENIRRQRTQNPTACPRCNGQIRVGDIACPGCGYQFSPSDSGLNIPVPQARRSAPLPPPPPPPPSYVLPASEQPTVHMFPPGSRVPDNNVPTVIYQAPAAPAQMSGEIAATEATKIRRRQPPQNFSGRKLNLVVGTRSDPGLKRKYKPNEDSLFAMQGARTHNSEPQQFGLFVVADGMGGHAKGQDASRQAIQTIIDFMLPKVSSSEPMEDEAFLHLLGEGVQQANQAVHQRNVESHADMGTTMTASLVVGTTAYVANVGDSRTYLYRQGTLSKVTNDHSVVASLVEAGIIQPDDIYTHPKRNQIYRSLGEKPVVEVDTFKVDLQPGDVLLLCSDGLWDMVRDPRIQQVLNQQTGDPNRTTQDLIKAALDGGGEDNVSVIVVQVTDADQGTGTTGLQLHVKPDTVTLPNLPPVV
jgi:serine/threonine protein phosphatase PrpC